eukprot:scaffold13293_cov120-Cylindrotheca_fusiformis.AAC.11
MYQSSTCVTERCKARSCAFEERFNTIATLHSVCLSIRHGGGSDFLTNLGCLLATMNMERSLLGHSWALAESGELDKVARRSLVEKMPEIDKTLQLDREYRTKDPELLTMMQAL